jgi:mannosyltransferase
VALAAVLRFWTLGHQGFWYDEAVTASLLRAPAGQMLSALPHSESTPPLYYLVAWGWVRIFGNDEVGLRSLSALAGVATVPVAFAAARELAGRRVGLLAALLVAVNPLLIWYSQEARSYSLLVLLTATTFWLFARARAAPAPARLLAWAGASALALCTHYFAVFVVLPEALMLLADRRAGLRLRLVAVGSVGAVGALLAGLADTQSNRHYIFADIPLNIRAEQVARNFMVGFTPPAGLAAALIAGAAVVAAVALLVWRAGPVVRRAALVAATVGAPAVLVPLALAVVGVDFLNSRNVIGALVPLAVAVAAGLGARRAGLVGLGAAAVLTVVSIAMLVALQRDPGAQHARWRQVTAALGSAPVPRAILLHSTSVWGPIVRYYLPHTLPMPIRGAPVEEIDVLRKIPVRTDCSSATWWGPSCDIGPARALPIPPAAGFRLVSTRRVAGFEIARYRASHPIRIYAFRPYADPRQLHDARLRRHRRQVLLSPAAALK